MSAADSACYVAKKQGDSHIHVYSSHDEAVARSRGEIHWLQRLQAALRDGFFELYVQPIEPTRPGVDRDGPGDGGVRAPARRGPGDRAGRVLPGRGALPADVHDRPLGARLGARRAFRGAIRLPPGRSLSINISGQTLADPAFLEFVVDELDRTGVRPRRSASRSPRPR